MEVWICGRILRSWDGPETPWAFQGVFATEDLADKACRDDTYFIFSNEHE